jgi:UDP-glucose 4-epimerase
MIGQSNAWSTPGNPEMNARNSALVTGGAGFIGRALVRELISTGRHVVAVDNLSVYRGHAAPGLPDGAELVAGDVRNGSFMQSVLERTRPSAVFHLAAIHYIPDCDRDPAECVSVNVAGAASMLDACVKARLAPSCVLASTAAVYAPSETAHREDSVLGPIDIYGLSKQWLEQVADLYARRDAMRISVARLFNVYGPGETNPHLIPSLIDQALEGGVIQVGDLTTKRDYVHVSDVAKALVAMADLTQDGAPARINVGTGRAMSGRVVLDTIGRCIGRTLEVATDASRLRPVDRPLLLSDPQRAMDVLGWHAEVEFEEGICALVNASPARGARA